MLLNSFKKTRPYIWSFTTYFTEGFPYSLIRTSSSFFFRDRGATLEAVGLTSLFGLPWILKFLWAPFLDEYGTKRKWLLLTQATLSVLFLIVALLAPFSWATMTIGICFFGGAILAATHDTAIDGFYMEALDKAGQAKFLGYRVMAYRIALMTGSGFIITMGAALNWFSAYLVSALILASLFIFHFLYLPRCETEKNSFQAFNRKIFSFRFVSTLTLIGVLVFFLHKALTSENFTDLTNQFPLLQGFSFSSLTGLVLLFSLFLAAGFRKKLKKLILSRSDTFYGKAFLAFVDREHITPIILFIIFIRTGEYMLSSMLAPFIIDLGIKIHYGWICAGVGLPCSIIGAMIGGALISRFSLKRMIWPFLLAQNLSNITYMALAFHLDSFLAVNNVTNATADIGLKNLITVASVTGFDQLAGGLGTAVLMTFLMRICRAEFKAAHYAIGTGLMSISGLYGGALSGFLASWLGYGSFFGISFLLSIPGMILIFFIPKLDEETV